MQCGCLSNLDFARLIFLKNYKISDEIGLICKILAARSLCKLKMTVKYSYKPFRIVLEFFAGKILNSHHFLTS